MRFLRHSIAVALRAFHSFNFFFKYGYVPTEGDHDRVVIGLIREHGPMSLSLLRYHARRHAFLELDKRQVHASLSRLSKADLVIVEPIASSKSRELFVSMPSQLRKVQRTPQRSYYVLTL